MFASLLPLIEAISAAVAQRHHLSAADADDFASLVRLKLLEEDSAILRSFRGESSIRTFLATVIQRIFLDERVRQWGKWRPSAEARRAGPTAVLLERLMARDGLSFQEACSTVQISYGLPLSHTDFDAIRARLRIRDRRRLISDEEVAEELVAPGDPEADAAAEADQRSRDVAEALSGALARLACEDRLVLVLRFEQGMSVAQIARITGIQQRLLYRRMTRLLADLRGELERAGFSPMETVPLIGRPDVDFEGVFHDVGKSAEHRPSIQPGAAVRED